MAAGTLQGEPFGSGGGVVTAVADPPDQVSGGHVLSQGLIREGQLSPRAAFSYGLGVHCHLPTRLWALSVPVAAAVSYGPGLEPLLLEFLLLCLMPLGGWPQVLSPGSSTNCSAPQDGAGAAHRPEESEQAEGGLSEPGLRP